MFKTKTGVIGLVILALAAVCTLIGRATGEEIVQTIGGFLIVIFVVGAFVFVPWTIGRSRKW